MVASEDAIGEKWDRCITDTIVKMGAGLGLGAVASFILFRRRAWPAIFGTGAGFGEFIRITFIVMPSYIWLACHMHCHVIGNCLKIAVFLVDINLHLNVQLYCCVHFV